MQRGFVRSWRSSRLFLTLVVLSLALAPWAEAGTTPTSDDFESGGLATLPWMPGGDVPWAVQGTDGIYGYSAASGDIADSQASHLAVAVDVPVAGDVTFLVKVSTEVSSDYLRFYVDDVHQQEWCGQEGPSGPYSFTVGAGVHVLRWTYVKNSSQYEGMDKVWIDDVVLPGLPLGAPVASFTLDPASGAAPLTVAFTDTSAGYGTSWAWTFGDGGTSTEQNPSHEYLVEGTYTVALTVTGPLGEDTTSQVGCVTVSFTDPTPTPDPMVFAVAPVAESATSVTMVADDASSFQGVEYFFEETTGGAGGSNSDWQDSSVYTDDGLSTGTTYRYRVAARAKASAGSETAFSAIESVTTFLADGFESTGLTAFSWTAGGTAPWEVLASSASGSLYVAASAASLPDSGTSTLSLTRSVVEGYLNFSYAVSSQADGDHLRFYLDGVEQGAWSGTVAWDTFTMPLTAGTHTFTWEYAKDASVVAGDDRAYLDDVEFPVAPEAPGPIVITGGGGGGCVIGGGASGAGTLLAVLLPFMLLGLRRSGEAGRLRRGRR